jgi:mono/diheme cytochrome c family protein
MNVRALLLAASALTALTALTFDSPFAQDQAAPVGRGSYLVNTVAACGNCHTLRAADATPTPGMFLAGGNRFDIPPGLARAKNITPDKDTGLGSWTDEQIIRAMREGKTKEGNIVGPPMPVEYYNKMSHADAGAIVAYLRTVPPI